MKKKFVLVTAIALLAVVCAVMFMACTPDPDKLKEKFKEEGYIAGTFKAGDYGVEEADIEYGFFATKITESVVVVAFKDGAKAKEIYEDWSSDDTKKNLKKVGNALVFGSENAVKLV